MLFDATFYILTVLCGVAFYLLVAQLLYWRGCQQQQRGKKSKEGTIAILLVIASALIFIVGIIQVLRRQVVSNRTIIERTIIYTIGIGLYIIVITIVYTVIWLRQRIIYNSPALSHLTNKYSRFLSKYLIIILVITPPVEGVVIGVVINLQICTGNCITQLFYSLIIPGTLFVQVTLLSLLIHPLLKHHMTNAITDKKYISLMRRIVVITVICLISDVTSILIDQNWIGYIPLQVNLIINLVCVIVPTTNWKSRLWPCSQRCNRIGLADHDAEPVPISPSATNHHSNLNSDQSSGLNASLQI